MPHATGEVGSQKMLVLAQGFPSEKALSQNLFFVTTGSLSTVTRASCDHSAGHTYETDSVLHVAK